MIVVDIIIALLIVLVAWKSFSKGIIMQLAIFFALMAGILSAYFFWNKLYEILQQWISINHYVLKTISVVFTVVIVFLLIFLLGKILSKAIKISIFGILDRILGMCFGILQLVLILSFIMFAIAYVNPNISFLQDEQLSKSYILPYIKPFAPYIISWIS